MLRTMSYVNLIFAVCYFLAYLQSGSSTVILGLLVVVVYSWLVLRKLEREEPGWGVVQWLLAACVLVFALYIVYSAVSTLLDAIDYQYFPASSLLLIGSGLLFSLGLFFHLYLSLGANNEKKDH